MSSLQQPAEEEKQPNMGQPQTQVVTAAEFNAKFRSKKEVFRLLSFEVGAYLPPYDAVTVWHLRDLASGKRKLIKANAVKTIQVPHFEGLTIDHILECGKSCTRIAKALPIEQREIEKLPRAYICNVIYTLVGEKFKDWVEKKIQERTDKIMNEQDLAIEMDPDVYAAFKASTNVSGK
jgi:hypothetical protein